jgi:AcrR family transcriptional regulator
MHTDGTDVKRDVTRESRTRGNRKAAQGASTRAALLEAGRRLFGSRGFADTSLDDIVAAAGVTKGALYHHFAGKEALFQAVYEQVNREITESVAPSFMESDPWDALVAGCMATLDAHLDPAVRQIVLFDGRSVIGWEAAREIDARYGAIIVRGALRRSMNAGVIERQPLQPLAQMLNGALTEACLLIAAADDTDAARAEVGSVVERVLHGLRPSDS